MQGKRIPRYPSTVDSFTFTVVTSAQTGEQFRAPAIFEFFDTLRTMTTTLDELNDDEPGNEDVPPHHHGKLTTRTTTRRRCSVAQNNRRAWRRRGRARLHRPPAAGCRISDSGWRTQVAAAARLMAADGCGLRQRAKHVEDDKGEL